MASGLKTLLTPELLKSVGETWNPVGKEEWAADFGASVRKCLFSSSSGPPACSEKLSPVLKALSHVSLDAPPDWMDLLPQVEDPDFPLQALGLQLIMDQGPRLLCKGVDERWTFGFFDELCVKYWLKLQELEPHLRPSSWDRWKDSVSFEHFMFLRLQFAAPIVHYEKTADIAVKFTDETRSIIEERYGARDPIRLQPEKRWDLYGFPKMISSGFPETCNDPAEGGFWLQLLMDVHKPILDTYGRYPYRNWILGRDMRPEEEEWLKEAKFFKQPPEDVCKQIKEDVEKGVWTPLSIGGTTDA